MIFTTLLFHCSKLCALLRKTIRTSKDSKQAKKKKKKKNKENDKCNALRIKPWKML